MLTNKEANKLKDGQAMILEYQSRSGNRRAIVQVVPIKSAITGRVKRIQVSLVNGGRGTVAR